MITRSEVKRSAALSCKSCRLGPLSNKDEKRKVYSSAYKGIEQLVMERSLMNKRKIVGDRTEPCGTPLLIGFGEEQ